MNWRAGADIAVWARKADKLKQAEAVLGDTGRRVLALQCDVSDEASVDRAFDETVAELGAVSAVFANAGVNGNGARFPDATIDEWRRVMSVNLEGVFFTFRAAVRHMIEVGQGGSLMGVSSIAGLEGAARNGAYAASKAGLMGLVRSLAVELARYEIRVNTLVPGWVKDTDLTDVFQDCEPPRV